MTTEQGKPKILIVEDSRENALVMSQLLEAEYKLEITHNGEAGLEMAKTFQPDLVLLDVGLPGMDGYQVCERLKGDPDTKGISVIFLTSKDDSLGEEKGLRLGAIDYIIKPFSYFTFRARLKNHVEFKRNRDELARLAVQDGLTGIFNRRRFDEYIESEWPRAVRGKSPTSLILADIDFFKGYNDNYGHTSGDDCLCAVARALSSSLKRPADLMARYGGEEFACVMPDTEGEGAGGVAYEMRVRVAALGIPHAHSEVASHVTVSLGVATMIPERDSRASDLINLADECLYKAKNGGRNRVHNLASF